jgi:ADP-heptose:LPS heptosyltransferase
MGLRHIALSSLRAAESMLRGPVALSAAAAIDEFLILFYDPALGTAIHATPLLEALRQARPEARITVATCGIAAQVIRTNRFVDRVIETPNPYTHTLATARAIRRAYPPKKTFCIVTSNGSSRSRITMLALMLGRALRVGFTLAPELYHAPLSPDGCSDSQIARNLRALRPLGIAVETMEPRLFYTEADLAHARSLFGASQQPTAIFVTRTSGGQPTAWPMARFAEVAKHLIATHGLRILLPGTTADASALEELAAMIGPGAVSIAGKTSVSQLAVVCALADLAVTLDTGGLHVARSQRLPLVVIAPAWQNSVEWMPLGQPWARILKGPWFPAPPPPQYAIEEVSAAEVIAAADDLLEHYPPSVEMRAERVRHSLLAGK